MNYGHFPTESPPLQLRNSSTRLCICGSGGNTGLWGGNGRLGLPIILVG